MVQPFYSIFCGHLKAQLDYFHAPADAEAFRGVVGGEIHETTKGRIWRVTRYA